MRAGFFVREFDGALRTESSYLEFSFPDRLAALFERSPRTASPPARRAPQPIHHPIHGHRMQDAGSAVPAVRDDPAPGPEPVPQFVPFEGSQLPASAPRKKRWFWLVAWFAVLLALAAAGLRYFPSRSQPEPIGLALTEKDGVLQVQWNHSAGPVVSAASGNLEIIDGKKGRTVALSAADLARGAFAYQRSGGDIEVRLSVESAGGSRAQEVSRYLGQPPVPAAPAEGVKALEQRKDELEKEIERLREQNSQQNARIQQLERTVRILQTRLGQK
jgi:hypothetical protein